MGFPDDIVNSIGNAVNSAGRDIGKAASDLGNNIGQLGNSVKQIPVVGGPIHDIFDGAYKAVAAPWQAAAEIAQGKSFNQAAQDFLNENNSAFKEVGPYAKMVCSVIPGVGTAAGAAIGAGLALANGQPLDQVALSAVGGAIPGGDVAADAFKAGVSLVQNAQQSGNVDGNQIHQTAAATSQQMAANQDPQTAKHIANAMQIGIAVGTAANVQQARAAQLSNISGKLQQQGTQLAATVPPIQEARNMAVGGTYGFDLGTGLLSQSSVTPFDIHYVRDNLSTNDKLGFDMATALRVGLTAHPIPPTLSPAAQAGYAMTMGMQGNSPDNNAAMMNLIANSPSGATGANGAISKIRNRRVGIFVTIVEDIAKLFGFKPHKAVPLPPKPRPPVIPNKVIRNV